MRVRKRVFLSLLLCFSLFLSLGAGYMPAPGVTEKAEAADTTFKDLSQAEIVEAMGAGWNLGNQMEATDSQGNPQEDCWSGVKVNESLIRNVARAGFKSIRIPASWLNLIGVAPEYKLDATRLARLQEIIDWALKYNLYVVMNIHGDGYSSVTGGWILPGKPEEQQVVIKEKLAKVWGQLADYFKDYDQHLIFESMNEIGADITEKTYKTDEEKLEAFQAAYANINDYNRIFLETVRQSGGNNDKRWVLIPGLNTDVGATAGYDAETHAYTDYGFKIPEDAYLSSEVPEGEKRIMVSVHYYAPWAFCGQEDYLTTQWGDEANATKGVGYQAEDYMEEVFGVLKESFTSKGYPVVIGEYGSIDKSQTSKGDPKNTEFRKYFAWSVCSEAKENGLVPIYWDNGWNGEFGYGLFDRGTFQTTQPEIIAGIMSVYAANQKGTATAISLDRDYLKLELSDTGIRLGAALTPETSGDEIAWSSSDTSVARVSYKGTVMPRGIGTCLVTATAASGVSDYCIVEVTAPENLKLGLYAGNSNTWTTLQGDDYLTVERGGTGGTYTVSLTYDQAVMSKLNTLFLKDVTVEKGSAAESPLTSLNAKVDEVTFNGKKVKILDGMGSYTWTKDMSLNAKGEPNSPAVDLCFMNYWYDGAMIFGDVLDADNEDAEVTVKKNDKGEQSYDFMEGTATAYETGDNTLTMKVTISSPVFEENKGGETVPVSSLQLGNESLTLGVGWKYSLLAIAEPANASEKVLWFSESPKVATVDKDGVISALATGSTVIHALTVSGQDVKCPVTVAEDDGTLETPAPNRTPEPGGDDNPSPTPGAGDDSPSPTPGAGDDNPSPTPGGDNNSGDNNGGNNNGGTGNGGGSNNDGGNGNGTGNGGGGTNATVKVKKVTLQKVKPTKKKTLLVQWKKLSGVTGYQIQLSTDKKFKKGVKKYTVKKAKTTKKTIKKLKSKKTYYVRVQAYKTVNNKKYTGSWSKVKKAKVK